MFTDKYMLTALMVPWLKGWIQPLCHTIKESGNELSWMWISREFGLSNIFDHVSSRLCMERSITPAPPETSPRSSDNYQRAESEKPQEYHDAGDPGLFMNVFPPRAGLSGCYRPQSDPDTFVVSSRRGARNVPEYHAGTTCGRFARITKEISDMTSRNIGVPAELEKYMADQRRKTAISLSDLREWERLFSTH